MSYPRPTQILDSDDLEIWFEKSNQLGTDVGNLDNLGVTTPTAGVDSTLVKTDLVEGVNSLNYKLEKARLIYSILLG